MSSSALTCAGSPPRLVRRTAGPPAAPAARGSAEAAATTAFGSLRTVLCELAGAVAAGSRAVLTDVLPWVRRLRALLMLSGRVPPRGAECVAAVTGGCQRVVLLSAWLPTRASL